MSIGAGTLNNADADAFTNGPRNSVVFAINCSSASIDFNSIGERWVKNPNGGSIAYLGTSRIAFITASITYQNEWYRDVSGRTRCASLGWATDQARSGARAPARVRHRLALELDGDDPARGSGSRTSTPNAVVPIQVSHPANVALGAAPITVTVMAQGTPVSGATVTLWKADEVYVRADDRRRRHRPAPDHGHRHRPAHGHRSQELLPALHRRP